MRLRKNSAPDQALVLTEKFEDLAVAQHATGHFFGIPGFKNALVGDVGGVHGGPMAEHTGVDQLIQPVADFGRQYFSAVFYAPDNMVIDVVYAGPCVYIFIIHTDSIS